MEKREPQKAAAHAGEKHEVKAAEEHEGKPETEIEMLKKSSAEFKDMLQRLQAEFENAKKREEREREEFRKFAGMRTVQDFLPMMDSIAEGIKQAEKSGNAEMKKGFEMLKAQMAQILERQGVRQIESAGKKFSHDLHDALMVVKDAAKEDGTVLEEFQRGYTMNGKVLRPAKVKINRKE